MVKNYADGERVPIRLVQENGDAIELDATSIDMVVERIQSNFGIPFMSAKKFGIDLNQAAVMFEVQGVFTDEAGQEATSGAVAHIDFHQTQWANPPKPGGRPSGQSSKGEEKQGTYTSFEEQEYESVGEQNYGFIVRRETTTEQLYNNWHKKKLKFPVGYWLDQATANTLPYTTNLDFWFDAGQSVTGVAHTGSVSSFTDKSSNAFTFTANSNPKYHKYGANGRPYVFFDGVDDYFSKSFESTLNPASFTVFTVAQTEVDNNATQTIFASRESSDGGYLIGHDLTSTNNRARAFIYNDSTDTNITGDTDSVNTIDPVIISTTYTANAVNLYVNGKKSTEVTGTGIYDAATSGTAYLGAWGSSHEFSGKIYETIMYSSVLSTNDRQLIEGYLAHKYNIGLVGESGSEETHRYHINGQHTYLPDAGYATVIFDTQRAPSKNEPFGYLNTHRSTSLTVDAGATPTTTSCRLSGNIKEWVESGNSNRPYKISFFRSGAHIQNTTLRSVDSGGTNITFDPITAPQVGDVLHLAPDNVIQFSAHYGEPALVLPLLNAGDDSTTGGPTYPNYADGSTRFAGTALSSLSTTITRTDEYIAHTLAQLLGAHNVDTGVLINNGSGYNAGHTSSMTVDGNNATLYFKVGDRVLNSSSQDLGTVTAVSSTSITIGGGISHSVANDATLFSNMSLNIGERAVNAAGDTTMDKVFSTSVSTAGDGSKTLLKITQVHKSNFGRLGLGANIRSGLPSDKTPLIRGFTGGKSGKTVKSAGDKVQDILGILGNSQNFAPHHSGTIGDFIESFSGALTQGVYDEALSGDYITAIQIPYNSLVTLGQSSLDTEVAQRNFFLTVGNVNTALKTSVSNVTHASKRYAPYEGHTSARNGIHGIVTDFNVKRDAAMKAYEFSLQFIAADIII